MTEAVRATNEPGAGVVYYAMGERWIREMIRSARSVRTCMPDTPLAVFCDDDLPSGLFDIQRPIPKDIDVKQAKMAALLESPFEKTLYLDTDTLVLEPVPEVFELLDRFELAACVTPYWTIGRQRQKPSNAAWGVPLAFPKLNGGVLALRRSDAVQALLEDWRDRHHRAGGGQDQPHLRLALYHSDVRYAVMPAAYNYRLNFPGGLGGVVKILHGRARNMESLARRINASERRRATIPTRFLLDTVLYRLAPKKRKRKRRRGD